MRLPVVGIDIKHIFVIDIKNIFAKIFYVTYLKDDVKRMRGIVAKIKYVFSFVVCCKNVQII